MRKPNKDIQLTTYQDLLGVEENTGAGTEKVVLLRLNWTHTMIYLEMIQQRTVR